MLEQTVEEYIIHKGYPCPAENDAGVDSHRLRQGSRRMTVTC